MLYGCWRCDAVTWFVPLFPLIQPFPLAMMCPSCGCIMTKGMRLWHYVTDRECTEWGMLAFG